MREQLIAIQTRERLTDGQMARRLNVSRVTWNLVKNERAVFSAELALRAVGAFPELTGLLLERAAASVAESPA